MSFGLICESCGAPSAPAVGICPYCKAVMSRRQDGAAGVSSPENETVSVLNERYETGQIEDALELTMKLFPDAELQKDVGFLLLAAKIMIEAEAPVGKMNAALSQAFRLSPRDPAVNEYMAIVDAKTKIEHGLRDLAEQRLLEILRKSPKNPHAAFLLGSLYFWAKKSPELAISSMETCVRERPRFQRAWGCLGALYRSLGNYELAARAFRKCLEIEDDANMRAFFEEQLKAVS
ncbi:MAG: tetratricopeptide repeat protein [Proteobacteria bacterium]|nr:MAG: tetratricopeptide repeat protein [Pseudomonadota bacterium]